MGKIVALAGRALPGILIAGTLLFVAGPALAQGLDLDHVKELRDKGKEHFDASANVDLSHSKRNDHRKQGFDYLTEAFVILDKWCEEHPSDTESLEDLIVEIHQMRYWLRKESPVGLLDDGANVNKAIPPDWPKEPPPDLKEPALPAAGGVPAVPQNVPARPDPVEEHMKHAAEYASAHPYDLAGIRDLYLDILNHAQPGSAEQVTALKRISEINGRLKQAYRLLRDEDPDTLDLSGAEEASLVHSLSKDLKSREPDVRLRAAEYLGLLRSGEAARHLVKTLKREKDERVVDMILTALSDIGGYKVTKELAGLKSLRKPEIQLEALNLLETMASRSPVEARYASSTLGEFAYARDDTVADGAVAALESLGPPGVYGLVDAAQVKDHQRRLRIIRALGSCGDGRAAGGLGPFLVYGGKGRLHEYKTTAHESLLKLGRPAAPYLGRFLGNPSLRQWTRYILHEITGRYFKTEGQVKAWYKSQ